MLGNDEALLAWFSEVLDFVYFSPLSRYARSSDHKLVI